METLMSPREAAVYRMLAEAAAHGRECPSNDDLCAVLACPSSSTPADAITRLERKGLIRVQRYQRARRVQIVVSGDWTAEPGNTAPHWRDRPKGKDMPTPAAHHVQRREPDISAQIAVWASRRGVKLVDALADLVFVGWEVERNRAAEI